MNKNEFEKFKNGETLYNNTVHNAKTTSKGFCFFDLNDYRPHNAIHFLSGIVNFDICAVFETDKRNLKERYGKYYRQSTTLFPCIFLSVFYATEYCTTKYSNSNFRLIKYTENLWEQYAILEEQQDFNWKEV